MGMEDRDWYRDHHRKKNGYKERAAFRVPYRELEAKRNRASWRKFFFIAFQCVAVVWGAAYAFKYLLL